jgi:4-diphosphocytidyl-2-C-methyl-D-erythritol kinase
MNKTMTSIELDAPAKVNLFLNVLKKRPDGYHDIATLFERVAIFDRVSIAKAPKGIVVGSDRPITADPHDNIAYKAARAILSHAGAAGGVKIYINKRIPVAAGLGGGSSDAAAVLNGINVLYNLKINMKTLMRLGAGLGADVPFFLCGWRFALGSGIGENLKKASFVPKIWHLIVYPGPFKASTASVYADFDRQPKCLTGNRPNAKISMPKDWKGLESLLHNDLGDVVAKTRPAVGKTIQCLAASLGRKITVSGSGPSLFCLYRTRREAEEARDRLYRDVPESMRRRWRFFVVDTVR